MAPNCRWERVVALVGDRLQSGRDHGKHLLEAGAVFVVKAQVQQHVAHAAYGTMESRHDQRLARHRRRARRTRYTVTARGDRRCLRRRIRVRPRPAA